MDVKNSQYENALEFAKLGYFVIPLKPGGKEPLSDHGAKDGTTDEAQIMEWWSATPTANVGIVTKNLIVIDVDVKAGGNALEELGAAETALGKLPNAPIIETGGCGIHVYFQRPPEEIKGQTKIVIDGHKTNIDLRVGTQYVVAPGSIHPNGKRYTGNLVPVTELPALPAKWINALPKKRTKMKSNEWPTLPPAGDNVVDRARKYVEALPPSIQGQNGSAAMLRACNAILWGFAMDEVTSRHLIALYNARSVPPWEGRELEHKIREVAKTPPDKPLGWLRDAEKASKPVDTAVDQFIDRKARGADETIAVTTSKNEITIKRGVSMTSANDVRIQSQRWLWKNRIPLCELTFICGRGSSGKSSLVTDWMARVSSGKEWPDGEENVKGTVLYYTSEESFKMSIAPKALTWGADAKNLFNIDGVEMADGTIAMFSLAWADRLEVSLKEINDDPERDNVRMIVLDPVTGALGDLNENKNSDVRNILKPLTDLAAKYEIAVVGILHPRKEGINFTSTAVDSVAGSVAFVNVPRIVWEVSVDNDRTRRMLLVKTNLIEPPKGLSFCFTEPIDRPELTRGEKPFYRISDLIYENTEIQITADEARAIKEITSPTGGGGNRKSEKRNLAVEFLRDTVIYRMNKVSEIKEEAKKAGFSWATIQRARQEMGIESTKNPEDGQYYWRLTDAQL